MHPALRETQHRPWPLPASRWNWRQSWLNLAFIHYRVSRESLRRNVPDWLDIDEHEGSPWISIVPFQMSDLRTRLARWFPPIAPFPELNLRTYVKAEGKPGVWFFSLDADCLPLVLAARRWFGLPYWRASMSIQSSPKGFHFQCRRQGGSMSFDATYRPEAGPASFTKAGTFEHWSSERYCLYSTSRDGPIRLEVHHGPWPIHRAAIDLHTSNLLETSGVEILDPVPRSYFSPGVDVICFPPETLKSVV